MTRSQFSAEAEEECGAEEDSESIEEANTVLVSDNSEVLDLVGTNTGAIKVALAVGLLEAADHADAFGLHLGWVLLLNISGPGVDDTHGGVAEK